MKYIPLYYQIYTREADGMSGLLPQVNGQWKRIKLAKMLLLT